jgi:hypothetical protein
VQQPTCEHVEELFGCLTNGDFGRFLSGCAEDLVLTVRGTVPSSTYVSKVEIPNWYQAMPSLAGAPFHTTVEVIRIGRSRSTVVLRHRFDRNEEPYEWEMVNVCTFRHALLATWSSFPLNLTHYAQALGIRQPIMPQLV